jgi:hypothetical protein
VIRLAVFFAAALALAVTPCFAACGCAKAPTVPQQASVAAYTAALESCVATAKATDGGMASYVACRNQTDKTFGRAPDDAGSEQ